ncbi:MAG TPA: acetylxylan esterase [Tepidisphaeraceae bacterium]|nr:acetylxylan esterase [Tepidisphaeraceae bacterium]
MIIASFGAALPGQEQIDKCAATWSNRAEWEARAAMLKKAILGPLAPWPPGTPLNPIWRAKIVHDDYTVQPVAIESMPGFYCIADLYMPAHVQGRLPAIIRAHGHGKTGRYGTQVQCAAMARMGAVVMSISMVGYNDCKQYCGEHTKEHPPGPAVASLQLLNTIRAVDFLTTLPEVDAHNINITGESGGGTQTFMLAAVDPRVKTSIPVVMVSATHTGCRCEQGPAGLVPDMTNHAEIAAMHAPLPQLIVSDGKDWTKNVPMVEFPYIKKVYETMGAPELLENVHLASEGHDYGPSKRNAAYAFFVKRGILHGAANETITPDSDEALSVFNEKTPMPETALKTPAAIEAALAHLRE